MKKILKTLIVPVLFLAGCAKTETPAETPQDKPLTIVATTFPLYDWTRTLLGNQLENTDLTLLLNKGADLHNYQPTADDIMKISDCDVFIYVGGESDEWVEDALKSAVNPDMTVISLLEVLGDSAYAEEESEGMQAEDHEHEEEEEEYDEHVWLSLRNAEVFCRAITDVLKEKAPDHAEEYENNLAAYTGELKALDEAYAEVTGTAAKHVLLFGDRFPFRYLTEDYGLEYYAAFAGCSAETEASFETVRFLAEKVSELELDHVMVIESGDGKIARTIIDNSGRDADVLSLDSMQSVTGEQAAEKTYLSIMKENLEVLKTALN
ncbi:MAG: zinc ABC transporter substrate-binding protein [Solobacterium sp.]|nr:zinc ABC transporter substrate-binding protein [Solobacterium sp.]